MLSTNGKFAAAEQLSSGALFGYLVFLSKLKLFCSFQEGDRARELTAEEERELDNVQANIRRIHRKSITDSVSIAKLPHLDKFEQQVTTNSDESPETRSAVTVTPRESRRSRTNNESPVQKAEETATYSAAASRELFASPGSSTSSPARARSRSPGRPAWAGGSGSGHKKSAEDTAAKTRAPSAKVKDKSRSKSPRPKSPPPKLTARQNDEYFDSLERCKENRWVSIHTHLRSFLFRPRA